MASSCAVCGSRKQASIHLGRINPGWHAFQDARRPGMKPMSDGMQAFREASGYAAAVEAAKGTPCQIVSPVCTGTSEHLHEPLSRGRAGGLKAALRDGPPPGRVRRLQRLHHGAPGLGDGARLSAIEEGHIEWAIWCSITAAHRVFVLVMSSTLTRLSM